MKYRVYQTIHVDVKVEEQKDRITWFVDLAIEKALKIPLENWEQDEDTLGGWAN